MIEANDVTRDSGKRGRLVFTAIIISLSIFLSKGLNLWTVSTTSDLLLKALAYFAVTYLLLIWSFRLIINLKSLVYVLPQSSLFVAGAVLFVEMFFFREFERLIDFAVLFVVWVAVFTGLYVSFLMSNVFNVVMFREIPLKEVAKTTSYILTLIMVYLFTFVGLALQWSLVATLVFLLAVYTIVLLSHFYHLGFSMKNLFSAVAMVLIAMLASVASMMLLSSRHEYIALMPAAVAFSMIGITMQRYRQDGKVKTSSLFEYYGVFLFVLIVNLLSL